MRRTTLLGLAAITAASFLNLAPASAQQGGDYNSGNGGYCGVNPFYAAYGSWYSFGGSPAPRRTY